MLFLFLTGHRSKTPSNIYLFDFRKPRRGVRALSIKGDLDRATFTPHGLNIWRNTNRSKISLDLQ